MIEQAFELNPPKREAEKLQTLQQVVDKFFGTDCESAETEGGTWKLAIADGDKVGELFYGGEPVCGIYNRGDKMEIEPYRELSTFLKLLQTAMLEHNPDKPVEIMDFQRTFETPLDKAKSLINRFLIYATSFQRSSEGHSPSPVPLSGRKETPVRSQKDSVIRSPSYARRSGHHHCPPAYQ